MMTCGGQQVAGREDHQQQDVQPCKLNRENTNPSIDETKQRHDHGRDGHDQRVQEVLRQLAPVPGGDEVVEGERVAQRDVAVRPAVSLYGRNAV